MEELKHKLDALVGRSFLYKTKKISIESYKIVNEKIVVFTPAAMNFLVSEINAFLNQILPYDPPSKALSNLEEPKPITLAKTDFLFMESTEETKTIKKTLLETLERLNSDATFIPNAKAICAVANSIIDIQRNEIEMMALINKYK